MNHLKKALALVSAAAMCSMTACTIGSNTSYALKVDGTKVNAGIYIYYAYNAYSQAVSTLKETNEDLDETDTKALKKMTIDGKDTETWILDKTTELCQQYVAVEKKFDELGLSLTQEEKDEISSYTDSYMSYYGESMKKSGVSEDSIKAVLTSGYKSSEVFDYYYAAGGEEGKEESEYYDHYTQNNARVRILTFSKKDGNSDLLTGDDKKEFESMVEEYYERVEKCKTEDEKLDALDEIESEYEEYSSEQAEAAAAETATDEEGNLLSDTETTEDVTDTTEETTDTTESASDTDEDTAEETSDDNDDASDTESDTEEESDEESDTESSDESDSETEAETETTSPYENETVIAKVTTTTDEEGNTEAEADITYTPSKSVQSALFDETDTEYIKNGDLRLINDDETEYIILRLDIEERMTDDDLWTEDAIQNVALSIYNDEFQSKLEGWVASYETVKNKSAYRRYDPFKIDLYGSKSTNQ